MKYFALLFLAFFFLKCENEPKCEFKPETLLKKEWSGIVDHKFEAKGKKAAEMAVFENGNRLELFQEVCHSSMQEFHFYLQASDEMKNQPDAFWIAEAMKQFYFLASLDQEAGLISNYGNFIRQDAHLLQVGEKFDTQDGISILIDRIIGEKEVKLVVRFG